MTKSEWLEDISNQIINCNKCDRLRAVTPFPMSHICYGDITKTRLFIIGRNPGIENDCSKLLKEDFTKIYHDLWWKCNLGKYLRENFGDEFLKSNMFFSNVNKCSTPNNTPLTPEEKSNCSSYLKTQLTIIKPTMVITLGTDAKDTIRPIPLIGCKIINLMHPSYFHYNSSDAIIKTQNIKIQLIKDTYKPSTTNWYTKE